jgi:Gram-negative bacterial TonB protein C-terminal
VRRLPLGGLLLLLAAVPSGAHAVTDKWVKEITRLEKGLAEKDWKGTLDRAVRVRQSMVERIDNAEELIKPLAQTLAVQALAEANLGRDDDAAWHWQAAQTWLDGLEKKDLSGYGRAKEVLTPPAAGSLPPVATGAVPSVTGQKSYQPVRIRQTLHPVFPSSLRKSGKEGKVRVRLIIGADGRAGQPRVLAAGIVPSMAFPVLDALRQWRFDPASEGKRPVAVEYELEIHYP